jgi:ribosomal protein S12 methylthiotransferase accessory factor
MSILTLKNGLGTISNEIGMLYHVIKLPRMNGDPNMVNYGVWPSDTEYLLGEKYGGRSAGCGFKWEDAVLGTIGETVERYAPAFYNLNESLFSSFKNLNKYAIHPKEFALFHSEQFKDERFRMNRFTEDVELTWFPTIDLTDGKETWLPGQFIYLPFNHDKNYITANTSTGLAAHTDYYKAILNGLYESIERDCFVLTWLQNLVPEKLVITKEIQDYIDSNFPTKYEWHFFDINFDLGVPSVLGFCFGEAEYGKFIAVGSSSRSTYGEALKKVIQEIGQAVPYFRYLLGEKKKWNPSDDYTLIQNFEDHSIFYVKRQDLWHIFDKYKYAEETKTIDLNEKIIRPDQEEIKHIVRNLKNKNYNVLFKDITTHDIRQLGFFSIKIFIPQLLQLAGAYPFYFLGGKRLYSVPKEMGYQSNDYHHLNKYPHPFP